MYRFLTPITCVFVLGVVNTRLILCERLRGSGSCLRCAPPPGPGYGAGPGIQIRLTFRRVPLRRISRDASIRRPSPQRAISPWSYVRKRDMRLARWARLLLTEW